jgi:hypothetical protein
MNRPVRGNGCATPSILNLCARWRRVVRMTTRPSYHRIRSPRYILCKRLHGFRIRPGCCREDTKISFLCWGSKMIPRCFSPSVADHIQNLPFSFYTDLIYQKHIEMNCGFFIIKINSNGVMQWRASLWWPLGGTCTDLRADFDGCSSRVLNTYSLVV